MKQKDLNLLNKEKNQKINIENEKLKDTIKIEEIYSPIEYDK